MSDYMQERNKQRVRLWRLRWYMKFGTWPATVSPINSSGNGHVIKMPKHKRQYVLCDLPDGPDVA